MRIMVKTVDISGLTEKERHIFLLLGKRSYLSIADELGMSLDIVRYYTKKMRERFDVSREELAKMSERQLLGQVFTNLREAQALLLSGHLPHSGMEDCKVCLALGKIKAAVAGVSDVE